MLNSGNILKCEDNLSKLNTELDTETQALMSEIEQIKELQSNFENFCLNYNKSKTETECISEEEIQKQNNCTEFNDSLNNKNVFDLEICYDKICEEPLKMDKPADSIQLETYNLHCTKISNLKTLKELSRAKSTSGLLSTKNLGEDISFNSGTIKQKSDFKWKEENFNIDTLPESIKNIGHQGIVRILNAQVKALTEKLKVIQTTEKKNVDKIRELSMEKEKVNEERDRLTQQVYTAKNILVKYEEQVNNIANKLQVAQTENGNLKKEIEALKKEIRQNKHSLSTNEIKLNRAVEETKKLKNNVQQLKQEEKEYKETSWKKIEQLSNTVKKLDKQKNELLSGFKKQLLLIDNLQRHKGLNEVAKLLKSAEEDFFNFLDSNPPNVESRKNPAKPS